MPVITFRVTLSASLSSAVRNITGFDPGTATVLRCSRGLAGS